MKLYRAKIVITNEKYYRDKDTLKHYDKHRYNRIVNHYFNEQDKDMIWGIIQESYPDLKKTIEIFKRSNPYTKTYQGKEITNYSEELIYRNYEIQRMHN